jgi:excisionase family DNA binding protein
MSVAQPRWLDTHEAADRVGFTERTIRRKIAKGELRAYRLGESGRDIRIDTADLDKLLCQRAISPFRFVRLCWM